MPLYIRPYNAGDREILLHIGAETAFFGEPIERYLDDRRIFMDAFYAYYTDYEPKHAWVACKDERVVGFLTGCLNTAKQNQIFWRVILPQVIKKQMRGAYRTGPKTWRYLLGVTNAFLRHEIPHIDTTRYPAHLHINLLPAWRGFGLGRRLIEAYLEQLRAKKSPGVHLHTTTINKAACKLYENTGFRLFAACRTKMYAHLLDQPVENRCYALEIPSYHDIPPLLS